MLKVTEYPARPLPGHASGRSLRPHRKQDQRELFGWREAESPAVRDKLLEHDDNLL